MRLHHVVSTRRHDMCPCPHMGGGWTITTDTEQSVTIESVSSSQTLPSNTSEQPTLDSLYYLTHNVPPQAIRARH
jgi:hypothetical protein